MPGLPEALSASGRASEKVSLHVLQSKMKCDPDCYEFELHLLYSQFESGLDIFKQQAALSFSSVNGVGADRSIAKDLGDRAMLLAHVTPFYPIKLASFPTQLATFLRDSAATMLPKLRYRVTKALILLVNRKIIGICETLSLFIEIQTLPDKNLMKLAFSHVVQTIRRMNQKHKNENDNRALQSILFSMLQQEDEAKAKRALNILCELHQKKVWSDDRTANAICMACFHSSPRIVRSALSFLLDFEKIKDDEDSDASSDDEERTPQAIINKEAVYKANHKGTVSSKKKKKAKLERAMRSMKKQQRLSSENHAIHYSPLSHLKDPQGFAEKLFSRLQTCNEGLQVKMMMLKVIARTIGLHQLILLKYYPFLQKYVKPHERDILTLLAAVVQACHDKVPPDAVEPLFKQIVYQFVDHSRPESIAVGLNVIREICLRMPLLMNEDLLQDLVLNKKSHVKAISIAGRSLITLFREVCPSLLVKKDRGRPADPKARPKAYGEVTVHSDVADIDLLLDDDGVDGSEEDDGDEELPTSGPDDDHNNNDEVDVSDDEVDVSDDEENQLDSDGTGSEDEGSENDDGEHSLTADDCSFNIDDDEEEDEEEEEEEEDEEEETDEEEEEEEKVDEEELETKVNNYKKRKFSDFDKTLLTADSSLRALKRSAETKFGRPTSDLTDGILSNEDFQRIRELKAKKEAKSALAKHGFKVPSSDQLSSTRVDPSKLEAHLKHKLSKEERLALVRAGRKDRGKYQARTAIKQKKTGGMSNRQKEHKKSMPLFAKRTKVAKAREVKRKKDRRSSKQFRGRKAWK